MPELEIAVPRPQRWDEPFGEMTDADVDALLRIEPFRSIDASAFPPTVPLRGILRGDYPYRSLRGGRSGRPRGRLWEQRFFGFDGIGASRARAARSGVVGPRCAEAAWVEAGDCTTLAKHAAARSTATLTPAMARNPWKSQHANRKQVHARVSAGRAAIAGDYGNRAARAGRNVRRACRVVAHSAHGHGLGGCGLQHCWKSVGKGSAT